jgi:molybdenum cofactor synthesis domain-containing protein
MVMQELDTARFTVAVLTLSDKGSRGEREDTSGPALCDLFVAQGYKIVAYKMIADDIDLIVQNISHWIDEKNIDLILTTGGTGVSPTDRTPEAMDDLIEVEIPGMSEVMRAASFGKTPNAVLSRGRAGIRKSSLIINLPGSKIAALENIAVLLPALPHALDKIQGGMSDCGVL